MTYSGSWLADRGMSKYGLPIPLTKEEEHICILCLTTKYEEEARETLILHNLRLVMFIAEHLYKEFCANSHISREDLISDGQYGLVKAARTFSGEKETRFATYAYRCIRNQMLHDIRNIKRQSDRLPLYDERTKEMLEDLFGVLYPEDPVFEYVFQKIRKERICDAYEKLSSKERRMLAYRYFAMEEGGLIKPCGEQSRYKRNKLLGYSQKDVSKLLGLSQSYVARLEKNVLDKLKKQANCDTIEVEKYRTKERS